MRVPVADEWLFVITAIAVLTAFGWSYFDGRKRRAEVYRQKITASIAKMPEIAKERFRVLFLPRSFGHRLTQAVIIGLGTAIVLIPLWIVVGVILARRPFMSMFLTVAGSVFGALAGEFLLNASASRIGGDSVEGDSESSD